MPVSYEYDPKRNLLFSRATGVLSFSDFDAYTRKVLRDESIGTGFVEVVDLSEVRDFAITYREMSPFKEVWRQYIAKGVSATLILAPSDLAYGVLRMVQTVIDSEIGATGSFLVLRDREELEKRMRELLDQGESCAPSF